MATGAELAFVSLGLLPVLWMAWVAGCSAGMVMAGLAATTWLVGDIVAERAYSAAWIPWANALTRFVAYGVVVVLAAKVRTLLRREIERATRDQLTGLLNRHALVDQGPREIERARRYARSVALVVVDLDNFKALNDGAGHVVGDAALRATAQALQSASRSTDLLARWGGDEFVVLLPELDLASAAIAGRRMAKTLRVALDDFPGVSASIGIAWFATADRPFAEMLGAADGVMYLSKQAGKGAVRIRRFGGGPETSSGSSQAPDTPRANSVDTTSLDTG